MLIHFAHANGIPAASYKPLFTALAPHQVIYNPQFGHNPDYPYTGGWQYLADELLDFLAQQTTEPVLAVGHSLGSVISFIAACKQPERFKGVLMLAPPLLWGKLAWAFRIAKLLGRSDDLTPAGKSKFRRRSWPSREQALQYFASKKLFQFDAACFAAFSDVVVKPVAAGNETHNEGAVELTFDVDVEVGIFRNTPVNLKSYRRPEGVPIKVIHADRSDASLKQCVIPFCDYFDLERQMIPGQHMFPLQQPKATVSLIQQFIQGVEHAD
ncbi:MAG TPA: alpha/beta hydrolase [Gammaproteobacteria bacterium]|nr:alpha/beta hydrolase [Gammaproteobacteria bacterium]